MMVSLGSVLTVLLQFAPAEEAFRTGRLLMGREAVRAGAVSALCWGDYPLNWGLVVGSALALSFVIPSLFRILPHVFKCLGRWRWNFTIEASLQLARTRDSVFLLCIVPFCLVASRYRLFDPVVFGRVPEAWRTLAIIGILLFYHLVRTLIYFALSTRVTSQATFTTARRAERNYFILATFFLLLATGVLYAFRVPGERIQGVLYGVLALVYALFLWRKAQILHSSCAPLSTFLYLCALEILPTGMLVAAACCL